MGASFTPHTAPTPSDTLLLDGRCLLDGLQADEADAGCEPYGQIELLR